MFTVVWHNPARDETTEEDYTSLVSAVSRMNSLTLQGYFHCWIEAKTNTPEMSN